MGGAPLTLRGDVQPLLEAFAQANGYGEIVLTFEAGIITEVRVKEKMRLPDQLHALTKRLLGA